MKKIGFMVALATLICAPGASALNVGTGVTLFKVDRDAARALQTLGVQLTALKPAELERRGAAVPIRGGRLVGLSGNVKHSGGLKLTDGRRTLRLTKPRIVFNDHPFVQVTVNGEDKLKAFTLDVDKAEVEDTVLESTIGPLAVDLSRQGARALNRAFKVRGFETGAKIADAVVLAVAGSVRVTGGRTDLTLDRNAAERLGALDITAAGSEGTVANPDGSLGFPITRGRLNLEDGFIRHRGGLVLSRDGTEVSLTRLTVDFENETRLLASVNGGPRLVPILNLDDSDTEGQADDDGFDLEDLRGRLTAAAAEALNQAFATDAFQAGITLGRVDLRAQAT